MSHIWDQKDRETPMQQHRRNIIAWTAQLQVSYDIVDDAEPYLSEALPEGFKGAVGELHDAFNTVTDILGCMDYFLARCEELDMTPEQSREAWQEHQPTDFLETMRDWQSSGPNEIALVDEFVLKPMGLPPCPQKQDEHQGDDESDEDV